MKRIYCAALLCLITSLLPLIATAQQRIVNIYAWTGEVPDAVVRQFEKETGIHVNFATYENNEIMYAKLRANKDAGYDIVMPSSYFVDRMHKQGLLRKLDKSKIPNWKNLDPDFLNTAFDPDSEYCAPLIWGTTGIFYNTKYFAKGSIHKWSDLWEKRFENQLMLLNEMREIFAVGLLTLGYNPNDRDPARIKLAYDKLHDILPNVKVFSTETVISIIIDEDANAGMAWNGDTFKAMQENPNIEFVYPEEGFVIWVDSLAIPKQAHHVDEAHAFINFILRPDIARQVTLSTGYPTTNIPAKKLLPKNFRDSPVIYPPEKVLKHGTFQLSLSDEALAAYEKYWEQLKMGG